MMTRHGPVVITGVNGLIGSALAARLVREGISVRGLDLAPATRVPGVAYHRGDLAAPDGWPPAFTDAPVVFHCARWTGSPRSWRALRAAEITATRNMFEASLRAGVGRVVHLSSIAVYGPTRRPVISEDTPLWPVGGYAWSKVQGEQLAAAAQRRGLAVVIIRPGLVYGPAAFGGTVNPVRLLLGGTPVLADGGGGLANPIYIENLVDLLLVAGASGPAAGRAFNVADEDIPWRDFFGYYARMCGRPLRSAPAAGFWLFGLGAEILGIMTRRPPLTERTLARVLTRRSRYSTAAARMLLGWSPARTMAEAMGETERWLRTSGMIPR